MGIICSLALYQVPTLHSYGSPSSEQLDAPHKLQPEPDKMAVIIFPVLRNPSRLRPWTRLPISLVCLVTPARQPSIGLYVAHAHIFLNF